MDTNYSGGYFFLFPLLVKTKRYASGTFFIAKESHVIFHDIAWSYIWYCNMESLEMQTWLQEIIDHLNESFKKKRTTLYLYYWITKITSTSKPNFRKNLFFSSLREFFKFEQNWNWIKYDAKDFLNLWFDISRLLHFKLHSRAIILSNCRKNFVPYFNSKE